MVDQLNRRRANAVLASAVVIALSTALAFAAAPLAAQRDPAEPPAGKPAPKLLPRPAGVIARSNVDEIGMPSLPPHPQKEHSPAASRPMPKSHGRRPTIPSAPALRSCGARPPTRAGISTISPSPPEKPC